MTEITEAPQALAKREAPYKTIHDGRAATIYSQKSTTPEQVPSIETACCICGVHDRHLVLPARPNKARHNLQAYCSRCGAHITWISPLSPEAREAWRKEGIRDRLVTQPVTTPQMRYQQKLAYHGPKPSNRLEAGYKIATLRRARGRA